jgi:two-component system sensor histidine kinase TctE
MLEAGSLRSLLQRYLLTGFVLVWAVSASVIHVAAQRFVTDGYDRSLFDTALDLATQIHSRDGRLTFELPAAMRSMLQQDGGDRVFYAVMTTGGELLGGMPGLPVSRRTGRGGNNVHYYDARYRSEPLRMAVVRLPVEGSRQQALVVVGETLHRRISLGSRIQWSIAGLMLAQLLLIVVLVRYAVRQGLQPLNRLAAGLAARNPADSDDLSEAGLVSEVRPLVASMNALLVRLRRLLRAQRQFIADASHQLRTPLAGIQLQLDLALTERDPARQRAALEQAHSAMQRAAHLSHQLLTLSRAEPQASLLDTRTVCDLGALAGEVGRQFAPAALANQAEMDVHLAGVPTPVLGDAVLLREMVSNLLDNAIRYAGAGARIGLRVSAVDDKVVLEVTDDGPGIAPEQRQNVFSRFYRIPGTPGAGCGLGLAIVAEIAGQHHASISLDDGLPGRGTRVGVVFPRYAPSHAG